MAIGQEDHRGVVFPMATNAARHLSSAMDDTAASNAVIGVLPTAPTRAVHARFQVPWARPTFPRGVWPYRPTLPLATPSVVCGGVPSRDAEPLRKLDRDHGYEAGCIGSRPGRCGRPGSPCSSSGSLILNNLTMPMRGLCAKHHLSLRPLPHDSYPVAFVSGGGLPRRVNGCNKLSKKEKKTSMA